MDVNLNVPALEKLLDYAASGVGSVAGSMLAPWKARREAQAKLVGAQGDANILRIRAEAQSRAREILVSKDIDTIGELSIAETISQRIVFQEQKRQANIASVVRKAAGQLGVKEVADDEPDHDWTARFFNEVQDVSSDEMQSLWANVLAGEVERAGSTSIRTLGILKNLNQATAHLFRICCSACVFIAPDGMTLIDARIPSLGGNAASNSLKDYNLDFDVLNRLNEHGLIISDYNSWYDYKLCIGSLINNPSRLIRIPFRFQDQYWILIPAGEHDFSKKFRLSGVALTRSGRELSSIVCLEKLNDFSQALYTFFQAKNLEMTKVENHDPQVFRVAP